VVGRWLRPRRLGRHHQVPRLYPVRLKPVRLHSGVMGAAECRLLLAHHHLAHLHPVRRHTDWLPAALPVVLRPELPLPVVLQLPAVHWHLSRHHTALPADPLAVLPADPLVDLPVDPLAGLLVDRPVGLLAACCRPLRAGSADHSCHLPRADHSCLPHPPPALPIQD